MADSTAQPRRRRLTAAESRQHLVQAATDALMADGAAGATARNIAAKANVSVGLINHHFDSVEHLLAAAYVNLATDYLTASQAEIAAAAGPARTRLSALVRHAFSAQNMDRGALRAWSVFWGMAEDSVPVQNAHRATHGRLLDLMGQLFDDLASDQICDFDTEQAALGLSSLIDGLWLNWCLQPDNLRPEEGVALCEAWIDHISRAR